MTTACARGRLRLCVCATEPPAEPAARGRGGGRGCRAMRRAVDALGHGAHERALGEPRGGQAVAVGRGRARRPARRRARERVARVLAGGALGAAPVAARAAAARAARRRALRALRALCERGRARHGHGRRHRALAACARRELRGGTRTQRGAGARRQRGRRGRVVGDVEHRAADVRQQQPARRRARARGGPARERRGADALVRRAVPRRRAADIAVPDQRRGPAGAQPAPPVVPAHARARHEPADRAHGQPAPRHQQQRRWRRREGVRDARVPGVGAACGRAVCAADRARAVRGAVL